MADIRSTFKLCGGIMSKKLHSVLALSAMIAIAGCQTKPTSRFNSTPAPITSSSLQGNWRATEGPLLASFTGTKFQSVNTENDQVVASGAFQFNSADDIRLEWVGALSGRNSAKCSLIESDLLSCQPSNGSGFQLRRV